MTLRLHHHFEDSMVSSWKVGLTHWEAGESYQKTCPARVLPSSSHPPIAKRDGRPGPEQVLGARLYRQYGRDTGYGV